MATPTNGLRHVNDAFRDAVRIYLYDENFCPPGMSAKKLSENAGLSHNYVYQFVQGKIQEVTLETFTRISIAMGMHPGNFLIAYYENEEKGSEDGPSN